MKKMTLSILFCLTASILLQIYAPLNAFGVTDAEKKHADIMKGKRTYSVSCILCHGSKGKGDGPASVFIGPYSHPRPANFTMENFKYRSTESGELPTLKDLMRTIRYGIPGYMPSFKHLDEDGIRQVALYISDTFLEDELRLESDTLPVKPPEEPSAEPVSESDVSLEADIFDEGMSRTAETSPAPFFSDGEMITVLNDFSRNRGNASLLTYPSQKTPQNYKNLVRVLQKMTRDAATNTERIDLLEENKTGSQSDPSAARGKAIFHEMQCIACHGVNGKGHEAKTNMKDERGLPIMAADLTQPSSFGNGNTRKDIFRTVMTGLNGTPMPSFSDLFIGEEDRAWDLVEYVYSLQEDTLARFLP